MWLPRFACQVLINAKAPGLEGRKIIYQPPQPSISVVQTPQLDPQATFKFVATLNAEQGVLLEYLMLRVYNEEKIASGMASCVLKLGAGLGKSYVAAALASRLASLITPRIMIVMHSSAMIGQWRDVITRCMPAARIGEYHAKRKIWGDIMLVISDSAASPVFTIADTEYTAAQFYSNIGFAVFDECHLYANKSGVQMFSSMCIPAIGLSATPDEHPKGFDRVVQWFLGPIVDAARILSQSTVRVEKQPEIKGIVHRISYYGSPANTQRIVQADGKTTDFANTINQLCADEERDAYVLAAVLDGLARGLFMFVFSDRRNYLDRLREKLVALGIETTVYTDVQQDMQDTNEEQNTIDGQNDDEQDDEQDEPINATQDPHQKIKPRAAQIVGGAHPDALIHAERHAQVILTTYPYMGTGKSITHMTGAVFATPRKTRMQQYVRRVFRLGSDTQVVRHIYDIVDCRLSLKSQWYSRAKYYKEAAMPIDTMEISDEQIDRINQRIRDYQRARIAE